MAKRRDKQNELEANHANDGVKRLARRRRTRGAIRIESSGRELVHEFIRCGTYDTVAPNSECYERVISVLLTFVLLFFADTACYVIITQMQLVTVDDLLTMMGDMGKVAEKGELEKLVMAVARIFSVNDDDYPYLDYPVGWSGEINKVNLKRFALNVVLKFLP